MTEKKPTIYLDILKGLQAVSFLGWSKTPMHDTTGAYNAVVRIKRKGAGKIYSVGEVLHIPARSVVVKAFRKDYQWRVVSATLPERNDFELIACRW